MELNGIIKAFWNVFLNLPWLIIGITPFWNKLRVKKSILVLSIALVNILYFFFTFHIYTSLPKLMLNENTWVQLSKLMYYILLILISFMYIQVYWGVLLYVFLFLYSASIFINNSALLINQLILGKGVIIEVTTISLPLTILWVDIIAFPFLMYFFKKKLGPIFENIGKRNILILCALPTMFFLINTSAYFSITLESYDAFSVVFVLLLIQACWLASFFLNLFLLKESQKRIYLESLNKTMSHMIELQQKSYSQLTESIERTRAERHDMRFHLSVLSGLVREEKYKELMKYLEEYSKGLEESPSLTLCNHHTIDVLARHYLGELEKLGVKSDVRLLLSSKVNISELDLCIIFGNLFDNSLNSIKTQNGETFFKARCKMEHNRVIIAFSNSCKSSGSNNINKGIGLQSVTTIAEKYNGFALFECDDHIFRSLITLQEI